MSGAGNPRELKCSNCAQPLRAVTLAGHYLRDVEIDVCDSCCLIWFDTVESARIAGPGVADLIGVIHTAMSSHEPHPHAMTLAQGQRCAICAAGLDTVFNLSKFGRTSQMQCPNGHGYYQTFMLFLAEKGFVRPMQWKDVASTQSRRDQVFCANCGAGLPARPHEKCPYCQSAVGVLDPERLTKAIDIHGVAGAGAAAVPARREQQQCGACGGAVDATRDLRCPHCQAAIVRADTASALAASESVITAVRQDYDRQRPGFGHGTFPAADTGDQPAPSSNGVAKAGVAGAVAVLLFSLFRR